MNVLDAITMRRSVRAYSSRPIDEQTMGTMRRALRYAPSACNFQPWRFILVMDEPLRKSVAAAACGQDWMAQAPLIVVGCGYPERAYKKMGGYANSVDLDVAIALDHLTLAAVAEGLGTCWIGAFNEVEVKRLLAIPGEVKVVAMTPLGYPASPESIRPLDEGRRNDEADVFALDRFDGPPV